MIEVHPYGCFIPQHPRSMLIGSFPIGKFTNPLRRNEIKPHEIDFFFGGERNLLWRLLGDCFEVKLSTRQEIIAMLEQQGLAIADVITACRRLDGKAGDVDLKDIKWNQQLLQIIRQHGIGRVYFTSKQVARWFNRLFPEHGLATVELISPSAQSVRGITRLPSYLAWKQQHPAGKTYDFMLQQYRQVFGHRVT